MTSDTDKRCRLSDYRTSAFQIEHVNLRVELEVPTTLVRTELRVSRTDRWDGEPLVLDGEGLTLLTIKINGLPVPPDRYRTTETSLIIFEPDAEFSLETEVEIHPSMHAGREGLTYFDGVFSTHCEPEGFRRITYYLDRPDILATFDCVIIADAERFPTLLSNGQNVREEILADGRRLVTWSDPLPKASYLFALVAGPLDSIRGEFITQSRRKVNLAVFCKAEDLEYCYFGLDALKEIMAWDESVFDREYDLDQFNIAVLRNYSGGAMESKSLNVYASELFLASPHISTDKSLRWTQAVVAHEYLHNWSGNRVGCQSWFELGLKEGLTIFRQQKYMADILGKDIARIEDMRRATDFLFPEEDGALRHAVRPSSYLAVNNLYTTTVYEKSAEIIRMMEMLVGEHVFASGLQQFFSEYDGVPATLDDLVDVVANTAGVNLERFKEWFSVVGPVLVFATGEYDSASQRYKLSLRQVRHDRGRALPMPVRLGLLNQEGKPMPLRITGDDSEETTERAVEFSSKAQHWVFDGIEEAPLLSIFRNFSAPVRVEIKENERALAIRAQCDPDPVNRWKAMQSLSTTAILNGRNGKLWDCWEAVFQTALQDAPDRPAFFGRLLELPSVRQLSERQTRIDVDFLRKSRASLRYKAAAAFAGDLHKLYLQLSQQAKEPLAIEIRRLRNLCLWYLCGLKDLSSVKLCWRQFETATTLEDKVVSLRLLIEYGGQERNDALVTAYREWRSEPVLLDHWFVTQALADTDDCAKLVADLTKHADYSLDNNTRVKLMFDSFTTNFSGLHAKNGIGYELIGDLAIALNDRHPRLGARFIKKLNGWTKLDRKRQAKVRHVLKRVLSNKSIASEIYEVASQSLAEKQS